MRHGGWLRPCLWLLRVAAAAVVLTLYRRSRWEIGRRRTFDNARLRSGVDTPLNRHTVQQPINGRIVFMVTDPLGDLLHIY
jgi:hypothetical protein